MSPGAWACIAVAAFASACTFGTAGGSGGGGGAPATGSGDDDAPTSGAMTDGVDGDTTKGPADSTSDAATIADEASTTAIDSSQGSSDGPNATPEVCDGVDNNLDGGIDEGSPDNPACGGCVFVLASAGDSYFAVCSKFATWDDARTACGSFGPGVDLAIIDDPIDQAMLLALSTAGDHWIGLSDTAEEGHWRWVDGSDSIVGGNVVGFDGWGADQPSGGLVEGCAEMDPGQLGWADSPCTQPQNFICRHPL